MVVEDVMEHQELLEEMISLSVPKTFKRAQNLFKKVFLLLETLHGTPGNEFPLSGCNGDKWLQERWATKEGDKMQLLWSKLGDLCGRSKGSHSPALQLLKGTYLRMMQQHPEMRMEEESQASNESQAEGDEAGPTLSQRIKKCN